jgi:cytochrome c oxidase cbb3-type subunit 3/ubiquinol-cytochrome c reductase cytochrome c subunit
MWSRPFSKLALALGAALSFVPFACGRSGGTQQLPSATPTAKVAAPVASAARGLEAGARDYAHYCQLCHAKDGSGYAADNAPSLVSKTFLESASDDFIAAGIRMGRPGTAMAAYGKVRGGPLEEAQIADIVSFLRSKGPRYTPPPAALGAGDEKRGAAVYEKSCQSCHGTTTTRGNALSLFNSELLAAASPPFLRYAIKHGRLPTPMPAFEGKLSEQEIDDAVAYLWSFRPTTPTTPVQNLKVPDDLPVVINPKGGRPKFALRADRFVSSEQVKKALDAKQRIVIVDARAPSDWIQFHIPGAISLPYHDHSQLERIPNDGTWVVAYCACPHHASGEVVDALRKRNYPNTAVLDEGILFWRDRGYPLVGESVKPQAPTAPSAPAPLPRK